ncbi:HNH endonuclease family protein [Kitasatospora purpeofusca]|uniref:HNH endonuclease family protein n=1 Tax=Kitasatospora purpeofusca TaxID=67352 RepID=UPI00225A328A|nr:HNH endonuclease family protein [Kitasatospora purpeofusca]MCX4690642.1 HNH endonuclease family protein [Kitasatospora purpeofusca]
MITSKWRRGATALTATVLALLAVPAQASPASAAAHRAGETVTTTFFAAVDALAVADERRDGYVRTAYKHWTDADHNGCNARKDTIISEALEAPEVGPGCTLTGGTWFSPYDDVVVTDASGLDVDHLIPLAENWDSGGFGWTAKEREQYANDLEDSRTLIAVTARSNRSKSDKDVAEWLPPAVEYRCHYTQDWVAVKTRWGLSVDPAELAALHRIAAGCDNAPITVVLAR